MAEHDPQICEQLQKIEEGDTVILTTDSGVTVEARCTNRGKSYYDDADVTIQDDNIGLITEEHEYGVAVTTARPSEQTTKSLSGSYPQQSELTVERSGGDSLGYVTSVSIE